MEAKLPRNMFFQLQTDHFFRNPAVREMFTLATGVQPTNSQIDPETAVALGAAILSSITDSELPDMQVGFKRFGMDLNPSRNIDLMICFSSVACKV